MFGPISTMQELHSTGVTFGRYIRPYPVPIKKQTIQNGKIEIMER